jgi:hypothetical protein
MLTPLCLVPLAGTPDEFLAALWQGGSKDLSSQASDEVLALGQYHKQLLAMRAGSGLEGIEVCSNEKSSDSRHHARV